MATQISIVKQDLLKLRSGIIAHEVNMKGKATTKLSLDIFKKWPKVKESCIEHLNRGKDSVTLGKGVLISVSPDLYVANLYTKESYSKGVSHTDHSALSKALHGLYHIQNEAYRQLDKYHNIYVPYLLGCSSDERDWEKVLQILRFDCPTAIVCQSPKI